jgi:hypothetical protein
MDSEQFDLELEVSPAQSMDALMIFDCYPEINDFIRLDKPCPRPLPKRSSGDRNKNCPRPSQ